MSDLRPENQTSGAGSFVNQASGQADGGGQKMLLSALFEPGGGFTADRRYAAQSRPDEPAPLKEDLEARAFADGYAAGAAEAAAEAQTQSKAEAAERKRIDTAFHDLYERDSQRIEQRLRETVLALCEDVLAPLTTDPDALAGRISKALALLRRAEDDRILRLHPDDIALVESRMTEGLRIEPDPSLERGALRVETAEGGVEDGPAQWRRALAEALGLQAGPA